MANKEIKTTFKLDGDKQYKEAVKAINSDLKALGSELKKTNAEFQGNEKSMRSLKAQGEILAKQYEEQKKKVEYLKNAVKDSTETYEKAKSKYEAMCEQFGKGSKEAQLAAKNMITAKDALSGFTMQLNSSETALKKSEEALKTNKKELKNLSNVKLTDLVPESAVKGVEKAEAAIKKTTIVAKNLATAMGKAAGEAAKLGADTLSGAFKASSAALTAYATAATAAGKAIVSATTDAAQYADDINTLSKQTGIDTETLQKYKYAEDLIDVSTETIAKSMAKLTKNMTSSSKDVQGAFAALGVSATDEFGKLRNNEEVFGELIDALGKVENETERDNLAMQIFGKSAQELNPLILGGSEQLKQLGDSAKNAGLILSQDALDSLNEFNDSVDVMKSNLSSAKNVIAVEFAGSFKGFTDKVGKSIPEISKAFAGMFDPKTAEKSKQDFNRLINELATELQADIKDFLPAFLEGFNSVFSSVAGMLPETVTTLLPYLIEGLNNLVNEFVKSIPTLLPVVIDGAVNLFTGLIGGLNEAIEILTPMLPGIIEQVTDAIIENLPLVVDTAFNLFIGLINGLTEATPKIIEAIKEIIPKLTDSILDNLPEFISAGIDLIIALIEGLSTAVPELLSHVDEIIEKVFEALGKVDWGDASMKIFAGLGNGLVNVMSSALGVIDGLFGTNLQKWYDDVTAFWNDVGGKLYEATHADEINATKDKLDASSLKADIIYARNDYIRQGMSAEEATKRAKSDYIKTQRDAYLFATYASSEVDNAEKMKADYETIKRVQQEEQKQAKSSAVPKSTTSGSAEYYAQMGKEKNEQRETKTSYYTAIVNASAAEKSFDNTASTAHTGNTAAGGQTVIKNGNSFTFNNYSNKALTPYQQTKQNEKQLQTANRYNLSAR